MFVLLLCTHCPKEVPGRPDDRGTEGIAMPAVYGEDVIDSVEEWGLLGIAETHETCTNLADGLEKGPPIQGPGRIGNPVIGQWRSCTIVTNLL
jgi:hypothetical protein